MNQKKYVIDLIAHLPSPFALGSDLGRSTFLGLLPLLEAVPPGCIVAINLVGVGAMDSTFARECILRLVKMNLRDRGICVLGIDNADTLDNLTYSAEASSVPITVRTPEEWRLVGVKLSASNQKMVSTIIERHCITASYVASTMGISLANASTALKRLYEIGAILRRSETAESGGIEYQYHAIRPTD